MDRQIFEQRVVNAKKYVENHGVKNIPRYGPARKWLHEYMGLVDTGNGESDRAMELRKMLDRELGTKHLDLECADIRRKWWRESPRKPLPKPG